MHEGVLVNLHDSAGLAHAAAKLLDLLHREAAVIHDPHRGSSLEVRLDVGEHFLILCVGHSYTSFSSNSSSAPWGGAAFEEMKTTPTVTGQQGSSKLNA